MQDVSFMEIARRITDLQLPEFDLVIGIAEGGQVPAGLAAYKLGKELKVMRISYRDIANAPLYDQPKILSDINDVKGKRILLVDDVSVSGKTLEAAKRALAGNEVKTLTLKGKADYVLFPEIRECVRWPWKVYSGNSEVK